MGTWKHGSMGAWKHGSMGVWKNGNMSTWKHGGMGVWKYGSIGACEYGHGMKGVLLSYKGLTVRMRGVSFWSPPLLLMSAPPSSTKATIMDM